jgi:hypothetical protein
MTGAREALALLTLTGSVEFAVEQFGTRPVVVLDLGWPDDRWSRVFAREWYGGVSRRGDGGPSGVASKPDRSLGRAWVNRRRWTALGGGG